MLKKSIMSIASALFIVVASLSSSNATEVNLGGFTGNVTTIVTHGFSIRAEQNNCFLVSGSANDQTAEQQALIGGQAYDGNGGCNYKRKDTYGNTASKVVDVGSVLSDDGRLNFNQGDIIDAGQSIALSFTGSNADGVSLNLSGLAMMNPVLDINNARFKRLTAKAEDHLETDIKLGNAYISAPISQNIDLTIGNYVQSQGVTAIIPIGVNVVNPVSLPILRSPGAQLKDALLPQAMVGVTAYLDGGATLEAYYQAEQKEVELDAAGTFFGSDLVGVGNKTGLISSANYREDQSMPLGGVYYDVANCVKGLSGGARLAATCNPSTSEHLWAADEDGYSVVYDMVDASFGTSFASGPLQSFATGAGGLSYDTVFQTVATAGSIDATMNSLGGHASGTASTLTDAELRTAFQTLVSSYPGRGDIAGLLYVRRAPDEKAKNSGQYGLNLSGYADNIGSGVEWGLYYNNSHSNTPRIRMLAIQNGYATDAYMFLSASTTDAPQGFGQYNLEDGTVTLTEQAIAGLQMGGSICALINGDTGAFANATHLFDPAQCYAAQVVADNLGGLAAARGGTAAMQGAATGALATLMFANGGKYQLYYPEDIKTMGLSLSTGINGWASNLEIAYRPDFPLQIHAADLTNNLIDSTYGTVIQSLSSFASAGSPAALASYLGSANWSAMPRCDISSTGKAASLTGYVECDGTAEFDVITVNANFAKSFTASEPFIVSAGADSGSILIDVGVVNVPDINYNQGVVSSGQFTSGHDTYQNGCKGPDGSLTALAAQSNSLFGNGYCEANSGADDLAIAYKIRAALTYNNFNNSKWSFSPSFGFNHDLSGNAPSSIGGFVEDRMSASATASFSSGGMTSSLSYQMELGDELNNSSVDKDYVSANFSYAF